MEFLRRQKKIKIHLVKVMISGTPLLRRRKYPLLASVEPKEELAEEEE